MSVAYMYMYATATAITATQALFLCMGLLPDVHVRNSH